MNKPLSRETTRGRPHSRALALRHGAARRHKRAASASVFFGSGQEAPRGGAEHGRTGGGVSPRTSMRVLSDGARSAGPAGAATRLARTTGVAWQWSAYGWQWLATVGNGWQWLAMVGKGWQRLAMVSNGWRWLAGWQWLAMVGTAGPGNGGVEDWLGSPLRRVTFGSARWWRGSAGGGTAGRGMAPALRRARWLARRGWETAGRRLGRANAGDPPSAVGRLGRLGTGGWRAGDTPRRWRTGDTPRAPVGNRRPPAQRRARLADGMADGMASGMAGGLASTAGGMGHCGLSTAQAGEWQTPAFRRARKRRQKGHGRRAD